MSEQPTVMPPLAAWFGAEAVELQPLGAGHINGTWRVRSVKGEFVLQQISSSVFLHPECIAANQQLLFKAVAAHEGWAYKLPQPLPDAGGETLVFGPPDRHTGEAQSPSAWRLCPYIADTRTLQSLENIDQAEAAGRAFGEFQQLAQSIDAAAMQEVIAGFYQLSGYLAAFRSAWDKSANPGLDERQLMAELLRREAHYARRADTQPAVIHGDCKVNNLLFAQSSDTVVAILDLDTLMAGAWWLDFGDLVRSAAFDNASHYLPELYGALVRGFFAGRGSFCPEELDDAVRAPGHVSYMLTLRFLTDHLLGDNYFKVTARGENLQRAQAQFAQLQQLEADDCVRNMTAALTAVMTSQ